MLNRIICFFVSLSVVGCCLCVKVSAEALSVTAKSAILMNADTGEIIYEKNAYEQRGIASTTKIMTSILALEYADLEETVTVKEEDVKIEGTSIGLKDGDKITLETLVSGMLLESGNDAANVTATAVSGSRAEFAELMNEKAKSIGMINTSFKNPSGLTEEGHYSTAYDMALLACYAIKNPTFRNICSQSSMRVSYGNPEYERTFTNHNKLLSSVDGAFGIKTGFTKASGRCLVSAAERNGVTLVAVTLFDSDDWQDHEEMLEYGFERVKVHQVDFDESSVKIHIVGSDKKQIKVKLATNLKYTAESEIRNAEIAVYCDSFLYAGVEKGDVVGCVKVFDSGGKVLCESALISENNAPLNFTEKEEPLTLWEKIENFIERK